MYMHVHGTYSTGDMAGISRMEGYGQGSPKIRYISNKKITKRVFYLKLRISIHTFNIT